MNLLRKLPILSIVFCSVFIFTSCSQESTANKEINVQQSDESIIKQGAYLVSIMGCNDCHSPKKMGANGPEIIPELMLSGYPSDLPIMELKLELIKEGFSIFYPDLSAAAGPWGMTFAGNLTPHETGIGNWTEEQFKKALTEGKYKGMDGGRTLLPPMPWQNYKSLKQEDIHAIFMYLKSIPAVDNLVPQPISPDSM